MQKSRKIKIIFIVKKNVSKKLFFCYFLRKLEQSIEK